MEDKELLSGIAVSLLCGENQGPRQQASLYTNDLFLPLPARGVGNGNPLQHSCLGNSMEPWRATVHGVAKSPT